jgi:hypothetical protein
VWIGGSITIAVERNVVVTDGGCSPKQIFCFREMSLGGGGGVVVSYNAFISREEEQVSGFMESPPPHDHTLFVSRKFSSMDILRIKTASILVLGTRKPESAVKFSCIS